ncbi:hypothetical protein, partial [Methylocella sp.]|uniref:hypothetical protein n=1 Tax=Methylocella sp. TaxID=1978226 RepID=UPI0037831B81
KPSQTPKPDHSARKDPAAHVSLSSRCNCQKTPKTHEQPPANSQIEHTFDLAARRIECEATLLGLPKPVKNKIQDRFKKPAPKR